MSETTLTMKIDNELKKELKMLAIRKDKTVTQVVTELIQNELENDK